MMSEFKEGDHVRIIDSKDFGSFVSDGDKAVIAEVIREGLYQLGVNGIPQRCTKGEIEHVNNND
jgi:hypothetical protein